METRVADSQKWRLRCALAFASQLALLAVLILTGRLVYNANDDTTMLAMACGGYGEPSEYVIFLHLILGYLLKFLFTICNGVNWLTVLFVVADMFGVLVLDMVFASAKRDKAGFLCTVIVLDVALLIVLAHFTFTVVAYWTGIAALTGITYAFMEQADRRHRIMTGICAGISLVFCLMIRAKVIQSLVIVYAAYIAVSLLFKRDWKPLIIALATVCLMLVSIKSNVWMNSLNPIQRTYWAWNNARSAVVDYPSVPYDEEVFSERGITYNQYMAIYNLFFYDYETVSTEVLENLAELNPVQNRCDFDVIGMLENHFSLWGSTEQRQSFTSLYRILFAAVLLFYLVFGNRKDYPFLFLIWGSSVAAECVFYFIGRAVYRVVMPGYLLAVILMILYCSIDPQKERKLLSLGISFHKLVVTLTALLACGGVSSYVLHGDYQAWLYSDTQRAVLEYMAENDDKVFLAGNGGVGSVELSDSIWNHPGNRGHLNLTGGWAAYSVPYIQLMESKGIQDPYNLLYEAIDNDKVLLLTTAGDDYPKYYSWILGLIEENYHIKAELEKVEEISSTDTGSTSVTYSVYKLVTQTE